MSAPRPCAPIPTRRSWLKLGALALRPAAAGAALVGAATLLATPAQAQVDTDYPSRPIRLVVGFPPGGPTDIMARLFAERLSAELGNASVVVENRPGAGTTIATDIVAKSKPDGYTLLVATLAGQGLSPSIYPSLPYDPVKDFSAVTHLASVPSMLVVHPDLPVNSVRELIAYAKARPGQLNYANTGSGTSQHVATELFRHQTGLDIVAVNYKGSAPAIIDLLAGRMQMMIDNTSSVGPHVRSGKLRGLAVTSQQRVPAFADFPTMTESGVKDYEVISWFGLIAPAGTPEAIVRRVAAAGQRFPSSPAYTQRLAELGATPATSTPAEFDTMIRSELARWAPVIKAAGVKVQ